MKIKLLCLMMVSLFLLTVVGCVLNQQAVETPKTRLDLPQTGEDVKARIAEIESNTEVDLDSDKLLQLSFLYSHTFNPAPDYKKSSAALKKYMETTPKQGQLELATYIGSLLEKIIRQDRVIFKKNRALKREAKTTNLLLEENKDLQKKITRLKKLDIRLEKRRLGVE